MELHLIKRDGATIGLCDAAPQGVGIIQWFHTNVGGQSSDWYLTHEGYEAAPVEEIDCHDVGPIINAICARSGVTMAAEFVPFSRSRNAKPGPFSHDGKPWLSLNWKITISRHGRAILETDYAQGSAHAPSAKRKPRDATPWSKRQLEKAVELECETGRISRPVLGSESYGTGRQPIDPPSIGDVMQSLARDANVLDAAGFESWAADMGMDTDSRAAESTYRQCMEIATKLRSGLGASLLAEIALAAQFN